MYVLLHQAQDSFSARLPENYNVNKFIKLPKKEKFGILEDLATNFFSTKSTNLSIANSSKITSKDLCLALPIEATQFSIVANNDVLANIFSSRDDFSHRFEVPAIHCNINSEVPNEKFESDNFKIPLPSLNEDYDRSDERVSEDNIICNIQAKSPDLKNYLHNRSKSDFNIAKRSGSNPSMSHGSTMSTTLVNSNVQFLAQCFHKKMRAGHRRKLTLPHLAV